MSNCDQFHNLSNGDDGFCLAYGTELIYLCVDWIGDWYGDPGESWNVCDTGSTKDHTLIRSPSIVSGNEWSKLVVKESTKGTAIIIPKNNSGD